MITSKSYCSYFLGLYEAMFVDIAEYDPDLRTDCERDHKRLLSAVDNHGVSFLCDTLVSFAKHFDTCLANGRLTPSGLVHFGPYKRSVAVPKLFKGLLLRVFHSDGELRSFPEIRCIQFIRQLSKLAKSLLISCPDSRIYENVQEFVGTDSGVRSPTLNWDDPDPMFDGYLDLQFGDHVLSDIPIDCQSGGQIGGTSKDRGIFDAVQRTADIFTSFLGCFKATEWKPRHGPGAVADQSRDLYKYNFPSWSCRLEAAFPFADFAYANYANWSDDCLHESNSLPLEVESSSKLIAVPKTYRAPRLIASEPVAHQWCQQIIRDFLMSRVKDTPFATSIRFSDQGWNGSLALEASHTGSHATIDLSSASDRISCWMVERLFRRNPSLVFALQSCRTRYLTQDLCQKQPKLLKLRKFSTMGSAVTFPVQTILFTVISVGCVLFERGLPVTIRNIRKVSREVRVFGDDMIVPTDSSDRIMEQLEIFGLKINHQKTFKTGKFRESCGVDAYDGHLVTTVNVNHVPSWSKPESVISSVDSHNNLFLQGLWNSANYVKTTVSSWKRFIFPDVECGSGAIGWYTYDVIDNHLLKSRWNVGLQRREYSVTRPIGTRRRRTVDCNSALLQYFVEAAGQREIHGDRIGSLEQRCPLKLRRTWDPLQ